VFQLYVGEKIDGGMKEGGRPFIFLKVRRDLSMHLPVMERENGRLGKK